MTYGLKDGKVLIAHFYIKDSEICRLKYSASMLHETVDNEGRNLIGRANKWLHWKDMLLFKKKGIIFYDWGGIAKGTNDNALIGINKFKQAFGGKIVPCWNYYSLPYYFLSNVKNSVSFLKKMKKFS